MKIIKVFIYDAYIAYVQKNILLNFLMSSIISQQFIHILFAIAADPTYNINILNTLYLLKALDKRCLSALYKELI